MFERYPDLALQLQLAHFEPVTKLEEKPFTEKLPLHDLDLIYCVGLSLGAPFVALVDWLEADTGRHLVFLEKELIELHKLLACPWGEKLVSHPQVHLRFLQTPQDFSLETCAREFPLARVAVTTMEAKTASFRKLRLSLLRKTLLWNSVTSDLLSGHLVHSNILPNFQKLPSSFYVNQTKNAFLGKPALICGAGPSLSSDLKQLEKHALVIGCGSALSALSHLAIRPDIGMAIDPNEREKECLKGCRYPDIPLIYGNRLYSEVFNLFDGPLGYLRSPTTSSLEKAINEELGLTEPEIGLDLGREALSITTLAIALACFWGCSPIILAGVDLAYSEGRHYAEGVEASAQRERQIKRKNQAGVQVGTTLKWIMEQETIDAYSRLYPKTVFINASKGLGFPSIPQLSTEEIKKVIGNQEKPTVSEMIAHHRAPVSSERLKEVLTGFKKSFEACLELAKGLQEEAPESGKAILYEAELQEERAYQLVLEPTLEMLERIYELNIEIPFSKPKWRFLQEMTEEYLKTMGSN